MFSAALRTYCAVLLLASRLPSTPLATMSGISLSRDGRAGAVEMRQNLGLFGVKGEMVCTSEL